MYILSRLAAILVLSLFIFGRCDDKASFNKRRIYVKCKVPSKTSECKRESKQQLQVSKHRRLNRIN